jgi:membrane fusion protein, multidrug efflux system
VFDAARFQRYITDQSVSNNHFQPIKAAKMSAPMLAKASAKTVLTAPSTSQISSINTQNTSHSATRSKGSLRYALSSSLAVTATVMLTLMLPACSKPEPKPEMIRAVRTVTIAPASLNGMQQLSGEVRAAVESRLGFRVAGKIIKRMVEPGQTVKAGQVLMQLDASDYALAAQAAVANKSAASVNRDQAATDLKRFQEMYDKGFISAAQLDRYRTTLTAAQASLDAAQAQSSAQGNQTRYTTLVADGAGVVTAVDAEVGQVVTAGTPVLRLARNGAREVVFAVPEDQLKLVKQGEAVSVKLWADNKALQAKVSEIAASADAATRTYTVKAALQGDAAAQAAIKLGMTATVELAGAGTGAAAIKLPLNAVFEQQGKSAVWVFDASSSSVQAQAVQVAAADGNDAVIAAGLKPGMQVVTAGVHVLQQGQKVKLLDTATPIQGSADNKSAKAE